MELPTEYTATFYKINEIDGGYDPDTGKWVDGIPSKVPTEGIILPLSNNDLRIDQSGTYTRHDRKIYMQEALEIGQEVEYNGHVYKVHEEKDYADLAGIYIYFVKRVGE